MSFPTDLHCPRSTDPSLEKRTRMSKAVKAPDATGAESAAPTDRVPFFARNPLTMHDEILYRGRAWACATSGAQYP